MVRAAMPLELVACQLGHVDVVMVAKVYGRWVPTHQERDRWEGLSATHDAEQFGNRMPEKVRDLGAVLGAPSRNDESQPPRSDWLPSSRGGTRTRDPGIMSCIPEGAEKRSSDGDEA
jgi:hypothetical protein